jgi:hypothetical protein
MAIYPGTSRFRRDGFTDTVSTLSDLSFVRVRPGIARPVILATGVVLMLVLMLALPITASAHQGDPSYESIVNDIEPGVPGLRARVLDNDDSLLIEGRIRQPVTVVGYEGEPMVRFLPGGRVMVNLNSPSYWQNFDRYGTDDPPRETDPQGQPDWKEVSTDGSYAWHDHRIHWMAESIPPSVADESRRTRIFDYEVPLRTPEGAATISGTLWWRGGSGPPLPLIVAGSAILLLFGAGTILLFRRRRDDEPG